MGGMMHGKSAGSNGSMPGPDEDEDDGGNGDPEGMIHGATGKSSDKVPAKIKTLANRIFLQIFSVPSLMACLADASVNPTGDPDGSVKIQLDFLKLPKEVLPDLERLLSTDYFKNHRLVKYIKNGQARTGLEICVTPKELPGEAYDYAF